MNKVIEHIKGHVVEVLGFIGIMIVIILVLFLKNYNKTYVCTQTSVSDNIKTFQKYTVKQKSNKLNKIDYYYRATLPEGSSPRTFITSTVLYDNISHLSKDDATIEYKKNNIILSYSLKKEEFKDLKEYKTTRRFVNDLKSMGFTCK